MKLFTAVLFLTFIGGIMGLKCYTCTHGTGVSTDTTACDDPFNPSTTDPYVANLDCASSVLTGTLDVCAKITASGGGDSLTARTCYSSSACPTQNGCASTSYLGVTAEVCCCSGSDCNGAGYVAANVVTAVALVLAAMAFTL